jgi:2-amino-4-hydroxy-6-hydroxymethyldihydropteridine diphosphokinase
VSEAAQYFVIGLGSSLGNRWRWLRLGARALDAQAGVCVEAFSRVYESAPMGGVAHGHFLNAAMRVAFDGEPSALLSLCQEVEARCGRRRRRRYGDRTLDLDLLWWSGGVAATDRLNLPHPELWERPFAWQPLLEVSFTHWNVRRPGAEGCKGLGIDRGPLAI